MIVVNADNGEVIEGISSIKYESSADNAFPEVTITFCDVEIGPPPVVTPKDPKLMIGRTKRV